jgi:hypothetical protein
MVEKELEYKGCRARVRIMPMGYRCVDILLPVGHKYYEVQAMDIPVKCHRGLTFSGYEFMVSPSKDWLIGFYCGHYDDGCDENLMSEEFRAACERVGANFLEHGEVRSLEFCIDEIKSIIDQMEES